MTAERDCGGCRVPLNGEIDKEEQASIQEESCHEDSSQEVEAMSSTESK